MIKIHPPFVHRPVIDASARFTEALLFALLTLAAFLEAHP
jgi:hypothetical protein